MSNTDSASEARNDQMFFRDVQAPLEARVEDLLERLTLEEKCLLCHGRVSKDEDEKFFAGGIARLGIPPIAFCDGPIGVRQIKASEPTTGMPCTLSLSCTWDAEAVRAYATVLAEEVLAIGRHGLLAPGVNLMRTPLCGRNFEYFGEDPLLAGRLGAEYVRALQALGVAANLKHLVANDEETLRHFTSSNMDERTLRELHLLPFEIGIVEGQAWTVMSANSLLNGTHVAENRELIQRRLKDEMGFDGVALTDWRGSYSTVPSALGGTDMTTGVCAYVFGEGQLLEAVKDGRVPEALLDDKVRRILRLYFRTNLIDSEKRRPGSLDTVEHRQIARRLAAEGMVLLKNDGQVLPLDANRLQSVLVTGPGAEEIAAGTGSSKVRSGFAITPLEGLRRAMEPQTRVVHHSYDAENLSALAESAQKADVVIFVASAPPAGEHFDLTGLDLYPGEPEAIAATVRANPKTVVVVQAGYPVSLEPWADQVPAILASWYAGQSGGEALADVLMGNVNPSAKLSFTWGRRLEDYPVHALGQWPPHPVVENPPTAAPFAANERVATYAYAADYTEGVFLGYRWFDARSIEPRYPFGHGLSYTSFVLRDAEVVVERDSVADPLVRVTLTVANTGERAGAEVVQVYVSDPEASVERPVRELKAYERVFLQPGASRTITMKLSQRAFAFWSETGSKWTVEPGAFRLAIGSSSRAVVCENEIQLR